MAYTIVHSGGDIDRVTVGDTSTVILAAVVSGGTHREYAYLRNSDTTNSVWLAIKSQAEVNKGILLKPGEIYEINRTNLTNARVSGICESGKHVHVLVQEGN